MAFTVQPSSLVPGSRSLQAQAAGLAEPCSADIAAIMPAAQVASGKLMTIGKSWSGKGKNEVPTVVTHEGLANSSS